MRKIAIMTAKTASVPIAARFVSMKRRSSDALCRGARSSIDRLMARPPLAGNRRLCAAGKGDTLHKGDELFRRGDLGLRRPERDATSIEHDEALGNVEDMMNVVANK